MKIASNKTKRSKKMLLNQECGFKTVTIATDGITGLRVCNPGLPRLYRFALLWIYFSLKVKSNAQCGFVCCGRMLWIRRWFIKYMVRSYENSMDVLQLFSALFCIVENCYQDFTLFSTWHFTAYKKRHDTWSDVIGVNTCEAHLEFPL